MVMHMHNIRMMLPFADPIYDCNIKSGESFGIIGVTINFFTVEQPIDVHEIKIESKPIFFLFDNGIFKPIIGHSKCAFVHYFKLISK